MHKEFQLLMTVVDPNCQTLRCDITLAIFYLHSEVKIASSSRLTGDSASSWVQGQPRR